MSNVIKFPRENVNTLSITLPITAEEAQESIKEIRSQYIIDLSLFVSEIVDAQLEASGFPVMEGDEFKDEYWIFLVDAIAAIASHRRGFVHPMHEVVLAYTTEPAEEPEIEATEAPIKPKKSKKKKTPEKETVSTE